MSTTTQKVAMIFGVGFLLAAIAGLIAPGGMDMNADPATSAQALGIFPVNLLHNAVHLIFGVWGLAASRSWSGSKSFLQIAGVIYAVLVVVGFLSPSGFGLVPLGGNDIWLHLVLGAGMLFFGFTAKDDGATVRATV